ncbi:hypothetical protein K1719_024331 [Acacia pycnantha]|nr:hypothetical protein K1719_024331 [Acacia pycnantha]
MEKNAGGGLRKGTWTQEEDELLRACVHNYGEGKWHLVPQRAGLKRCRKSCRMRWLNYLKPNINRTSFTEDEVDMIRRWSLIAGRLPGRTANDVKNFWHTNMRNRKKKEERQETKAKEVAMHNNVENTTTEEVKPQVVIKPQPHTFSKNSPWLRRNNNKKKVVSASDGEAAARTSSGDFKEGMYAEACSAADFTQRDHLQSEEWWESLMDKEVDEGQFGDFAMELWDYDFLKLGGPFGEGKSCRGHCSGKF